MKASRKFSYFSSSSSSAAATTTTVTYASDHNGQTAPKVTIQIPIQSPASSESHQPDPHSQAAAAAKIQSAYRAHTIRSLYNQISAVNYEADELQRQIQRQETVDAMRGSEKERVRMNEALMGLLLRLDSVPGRDPAVREARRKASHRIVGLQEVMDAICGAETSVWECDILNWEEWEGEVCRERGGEEMERFCAEYLGFRCLYRFLHHS